MSELLLEKQLRESKPEDEVRKLARVRTLTVLQRLDAERKVSVLRFLLESGLINKDKRIIDLSGADLNEVNLFGVDLRGADLRGANLSEANLSYAKLSGDIQIIGEVNISEPLTIHMSLTILSGVNLTGADLSNADLSNADLSQSNLSNAKLSGVDLRRAKLSGARLSEAKLNEADLLNAQLDGADLSKALQLHFFGETRP